MKATVDIIEPHAFGELLVTRALTAILHRQQLSKLPAFRGGGKEKRSLAKVFEGVTSFVPRAPLCSLEGLARAEVELDSEHEVDVLAVHPDRPSVPIEVKLGREKSTAMAAKKFVELYVRSPSISKSPRYASGSVPGLLDLHLQAPPAWIPGHVADQTLRARRSSDVAVSLTRDWVLVVRDEVLAKWQRGSWPPFSSGVGPWVFTLDSVARALTREDFNRLALTCMFDPPDFANRWGLSLNDEPNG